MIRGNASSKIGELLIGWTLLSILIVLAFNAFSASRVIETDSQDLLEPNFYISSKELRNQRIATLLESQSKGLEFMVWKQERNALSRELSQLLRERINIDPYYGLNWIQLIYLQKQTDASIGERAWTLKRAATLLKWNVENRLTLIHYCLSEYAEFIKVIPDTCSSLISSLPSQWSQEHAAERAKVRLDVLRSVLALERTRLGHALSDGRSIP